MRREEISDTEKKITFCMLIKDVEKNDKIRIFEKIIAQAVKLSKKFLIVNNNSSDNTRETIMELKNKYGLNLEYYEDKRTYFDYLKWEYSNKINTDYIFILDDDEYLTDELIEDVKVNINKDYNLFIFRWNTYLLNKCVCCSTKPILFKKTNNIMMDKPGLHMQFDKSKIRAIKSEKIYKSKNEIEHFSYNSIKQLSEKTDQYAKTEAVLLYNENPNLSNFKILVRFLYESTIYFLGNLLFLKGWKNLIAVFYCFNSIVYRWKKYFYYLELKHKNV